MSLKALEKGREGRWRSWGREVVRKEKTQLSSPPRGMEGAPLGLASAGSSASPLLSHCPHPLQKTPSAT